jgi:hypothetical protein
MNWKDVVVASFDVLSKHLLGGTEENLKNPHTGQNPWVKL